LLEVIEQFITGCGIGKVGNRGRARPGDDRSEDNAKQNGTAHAVHHKEKGENPARVVEFLKKRRMIERVRFTYPPVKIPSHIVGLLNTPWAQ